MATDLQTILSWFKTGLKPTQAQFWASWSSFWHKDEAIPQSSVSGLTNVLNAKTENDQFNAYKVANDARMQAKEDKTQKGLANGYAPLDEFTKLAAQYLNIVNDLVTGGATALLSAEQGKVLQTQISAINTLLTSDNVNLDTVQELVDAIETVQMSLSSILVNDLSTGGTTKALTAEMGKQLDLIKESTANKSTSIVVDYLSNIKFPSVKAVYDFCMSAFKKKFLAFGDVPGITHTFGAGSENTMFKFSNNNPITATIPTNSTTPFEIGTVFETIAIGNGALTVTGAPGVTILTNLSNTSVKNEVRRYTKIDTDTWTVEGNRENKAIESGVVFVSSNGNDSTGEYQNSLKPYRTIDAAITCFIANPDSTQIKIISDGSFTITTNMALNRSILIYSLNSIILTFTWSGGLFTPNKNVKIDVPNGSIVFNPTIDNTGFFTSGNREFNSNICQFNISWSGSSNENFGETIIMTKTLNVLCAGRRIMEQTGGNRRLKIIADTINMRGSYPVICGNFTSLYMDFNLLTHDNGFRVNYNSYGSAVINHGNITSIAPYVNTTRFDYLYGTELTVFYKANASIQSNISIYRYNVGGTTYISGAVSLPNADFFIYYGNSGTLVFKDANITAKNLIGPSELYQKVFVSNSVFNLSSGKLCSYIEPASGANYAQPTMIFEGVNTVIVPVDDSFITVDESNWVSTNNPQWDLRNGILLTNGKISGGVSLLKRNLNQYNGTTII